MKKPARKIKAKASPRKQRSQKSLKSHKAHSSRPGHWITVEKFSQLQETLREAQETLEAIRSGEVDAVVVHGPRGNQIYSLTGADQPYRVYVERMQEGAATISDDGLILYANQRFAEMVNEPLERVISAKASAFINAAAWKKIHTVFEHQQEVVKCETLLQPLEKPYLPVNLAASHLPLQGQNVLCLVVSDLSAQKQNEELRLAKEVAEKANIAKDAFMAALSHELRTPLNPVLLLASEAVNDYELPPKIRADFAIIRNNIELEARLIDDLLDLTRITHGKLTLDLQPVDCHEILDHALATVEADLRQKNITLKTDLGAGACFVKADAMRLQQVFWNVLKNAVKFTPEKGRIQLTTRIHPEKQQVTIIISDTGIGITRDEISRIFEAFSQGDHVHGQGAHQFGGLGMGLAISKMLVKMHSGDITATSAGRGQGATFTIELPLAQPAVKERAKSIPAPSAPETPAASRERTSILLVEDHEPTRSALTRLLLRRNHAVISAGTAAEARSLAANNKFHLIISDIGLPDGSGFDLMKDLHARYQLKGIALTGYGMEQDVVASQESGFLSHLTKPVRIQSLEAALAAVLLA